MQAAACGMLLSTPSSFFEDTAKSLKAGAELCYNRVQSIKGLDCPTKPQGAMYIMVNFLPQLNHVPLYIISFNCCFSWLHVEIAS